MSGFSTIKPKQAGRKDEVKIDDVLGIFKFPEGEFAEVRFIPGPILALKQHWIKIRGGKDKREIKVPRWCIAFDPATEGPNGKKCPYCELSTGQDGAQQESIKYYANAIIRDMQENEPRKKVAPSKEERKSGFIQAGSKAFTPIRVVALTPTLAQKLQDLEQLNMHKDKKTSKKKSFPLSHPVYGKDVSIKFDNSKAGSDKYNVVPGEKTKLTDEEKEYLVWNLNPDVLDKLGLKSEKEAKEDFKRMDVIGGDEPEDDDDDDDSGGRRLGAKGKKAAKGKGKSRDDDEDDEDDDDEDDRPSKKSKAKKPSRFDDDDDEDDDDDDSDDDEDDDDDDRPSKKSKSKGKKPSKGKGKKSSFDDDDDDDDDEDDDDDDDDDRPSKKSKSKSKSKDKKPAKGKAKKSSFDDDDDDDDDDEPPVKKKKKKK